MAVMRNVEFAAHSFDTQRPETSDGPRGTRRTILHERRSP